MAYNNRNKYLLIKDVQELYLLHKKDELTTRFVHKTYIYPIYKISIATLYNYLATNVRKELRQMSLFDEAIES